MANPRTYLISGAGTGIGRAIAKALAGQSETSKLVLLGRNLQTLEETLSQLANPDRHLIVQADIRDAKRMRDEFNRIQLSSLQLTGIIANSGVGGENRYGEGDRWDEVIGTNLTGTYQLVNEALPALRASSAPYKHVVVISSILSRIGVPHYSAYCASKAGLLGLVRSWAAEWSSKKILVNAICPGWVDTEMARQGISLMSQRTGKSLDQTLSEQMSHVPLGRMSQPDEIGALVNFLVSDQQTSITGQAIDINNGAFMA